MQGRVEVFYNSQWGTVCDDIWDNNDAAVVCRYLGFKGSATAFGNAHFGQAGAGAPFWLDQVNCAGNEASLFDCSHPGIGVDNCSHSEDAGVDCSS